MSGLPLHLAALLLGAVIFAAVAGFVYLAIGTKLGAIAFYVVLVAVAAYCFGRAALLLLGWTK